MQRLGLAGHKSASYSLLAQPGFKALHFVLESAAFKISCDTANLARSAIADSQGVENPETISSRNHLRSFVSNLAAQGITYDPLARLHLYGRMTDSGPSRTIS